MNRPVHFEILCSDMERASKFYDSVFGWKIQKWGDEGMEYWLVNTGEEGVAGINGGLMNTNQVKQPVINTMAVESLDDSLAKVVASGGKVVTEKAMIPNVGWFSYCEDTEGVVFGMLQPVGEM